MDYKIILKKKKLIYKGIPEKPKGGDVDEWEPREQYLFKSTKFGDDVDRSLQKFDGEYTYFAKDVAYHFDKYNRGYSSMINVWGADHGGYIKRLSSAVNAIKATQIKGSNFLIIFGSLFASLIFISISFILIMV